MVDSKGCNIPCIKAWARAFQFIGAALLMVLVIIRFITLAFADPPAFILTIYYVAFACLLVVAEFQLRFVMQFFHFLYYSWGKAVMDFFLFTICFDTSNNIFFQVPVAIFFLFASCMYLIIAFACKANPEAEEAKKQNQEEAKAAKAPAESAARV